MKYKEVEDVILQLKKQYPNKNFEVLTPPEEVADIYAGLKDDKIIVLETSDKPIKLVFEGTNPCPYCPQVQCEYCGCNETDFEIIYTCELPKKKQCPYNIIY